MPKTTPARIKARASITAEYVRSALYYDPLTGEFRWLVNLGRNCCAGKVAGVWNRGRHRIRVCGLLWEAPILAHLIMTGEWPVDEMDHRDTDTRNNRWKNLRAASTKKNCMNQGKRKTNTSGFKGVTAHAHGTWWARISADGHRYQLGLYPTAEMAAAAYRIASAGMHGEFSGVQ